jgi:hypothetical protein
MVTGGSGGQSMAKGQKRSNREIRKPKAEKKPLVTAPATFAKGTVPTTTNQKKKG